MKKNNISKRLKSMQIDFCFICVSSTPFVLLLLIFKLDGNLAFQTLSFSDRETLPLVYNEWLLV